MKSKITHTITGSDPRLQNEEEDGGGGGGEGEKRRSRIPKYSPHGFSQVLTTVFVFNIMCKHHCLFRTRQPCTFSF